MSHDLTIEQRRDITDEQVRAVGEAMEGPRPAGALDDGVPAPSPAVMRELRKARAALGDAFHMLSATEGAESANATAVDDLVFALDKVLRRRA